MTDAQDGNTAPRPAPDDCGPSTTALYWRDHARKPEYPMVERFLFLENAYNAVVNELVALQSEKAHLHTACDDVRALQRMAEKRAAAAEAEREALAEAAEGLSRAIDAMWNDPHREQEPRKSLHMKVIAHHQQHVRTALASLKPRQDQDAKP